MKIVASEYGTILIDLKEKIRRSQQRAILSVNYELVLLYWDIGHVILQQQMDKGWGVKIIDSLSADLKKAFPDVKGFSVRNLKYMRQFADNYPDRVFVQELLAQLNWYVNITIMQKVKDKKVRSWYISQTIEHGWSQAVLVHQIESELYVRSTVNKTTNFSKTLTTSQSELISETMKDPYIFDFLTLGEDVKEKDIEEQLVKHITKFLLELGEGFAFVGNQYKLEVGEKDFYIDLLFYHLKLKCYFVIELKSVAFKPEFAGKLNFYLSAVDDLLRSESDNPTIGLILCKSKNKVEAEYSLRDLNKPMGVSEYEITKSLPQDLQTKLPTIEAIEGELEDE